jgi:hypothetical protein
MNDHYEPTTVAEQRGAVANLRRQFPKKTRGRNRK